MRIGIDARSLSRELTGIGYYLLNILKEIDCINEGHEFYLYSDFDFEIPFKSKFWHKRFITSRPRLMGALWLYTTCTYLALKDKIEVFWAPWPLLPLHLPIRQVLTVHDFTWKYHPDTMDLTQKLLYFFLGDASIHRASVVFAVSQSTMNDVIKIVPRDRQKIFLTYNGLNSSFYSVDKVNSSRVISQKFSNNQPYILNVGTIEPRKNISALLKAFKIIKDKYHFPHRLLIAGGKGWKNSGIYEQYKSLGLEDDVQFLGYVEDGLMPHLYAAADLFVFPALYEGFGFPVLEAMACGCPVVTSGVSSMPEVVSDAGELVDPLDINDIVRGIVKVLSNQEIKDEFIKRGLERSKQFRWGDTVRIIYDCLTERKKS